METEKIYDGIDFMGDDPSVNFKILIITGLAVIGIGALTWYFFKKDKKCSQESSQQSSL